MTTVGEIRKVITTEIEVDDAGFGAYQVSTVVHERTVRPGGDDLLVELLDDQDEPIASWGGGERSEGYSDEPMPSWVKAILRSASCRIPSEP